MLIRWELLYCGQFFFNLLNQNHNIVRFPGFVYVCLIICLLGTIFIPKDLKYNYIQDREQKIQKLQNENIELNLTIQKYNLQKELQELRKQDVYN